MKAVMIGVGALALSALAGAGPAAAQANVMKECAAKYQAAKTAKTLPAGQTWMQYLAQCRGTVAKPVVAAPTPAMVATKATAASATKTTAVRTVATQKTTATNVPAGTRTAGQLASADRQKKCGAMWKADKAAGKTGSQTWPQYWSACSKRLKG